MEIPALVPFDVRLHTSNFAGRHGYVKSCSSSEHHPCHSGGDDDDLAPHAMPLLCWKERRGTAHLHHSMWCTTDPVSLCLLCTAFFRNTPYPYCPVENAHCPRGASPFRPDRRSRYQRGDTALWREQK